VVSAMENAEIEALWLRLRGPDGKPVCSRCGNATFYDCRRPGGALRWRCKACLGDLPVTAGTRFEGAKVPLRTILGVLSWTATFSGKQPVRAGAVAFGFDYSTFYHLWQRAREALTLGLAGPNSRKGSRSSRSGRSKPATRLTYAALVERERTAR